MEKDDSEQNRKKLQFPYVVYAYAPFINVSVDNKKSSVALYVANFRAIRREGRRERKAGEGKKDYKEGSVRF